MESVDTMEQQPQDLQVPTDGSPSETLLVVASDDTTMPTSNMTMADNYNNFVVVPSSTVMLHPMTKLQVSLLDTLSDLQIRNEVQDCMDSLLLDVETTYYLRRELELQATQHALDMATKHHQATILEANAERQARENEKLALADQLVQEFMALSREMEELLQWKRENTHKVQEYETLLAKLMQTEEALEVAQYRASQVPIAPPSMPETSVEDLTSTPSLEQQQEEEEKVTTKNLTTVTTTTTESQPADATLIVPSPSQDESITETSILQQESTEDSKPAAFDTDTDTSKTTTAAVTLDDDHPDDQVNGLVDLDVEILMTIFGFLDAEDILSMAQINLAMYTKIDNIFGISEDGQTPPSAKPATTTPATTATRPPATTTASTKPAPIPPTMAQVPPTPSQSAAAATPPTGPLGNRLFSMLQPANKAAAAAAGAKKSSSQGLNPTLAQSMASKLSDAEIAAILSMTDKLSRMDKQVTTLLAEKEALSAKLDGTEAVKQFLINKVRDVELKLSQSREDEVKVTQQIASDQEVIAFLDTRVQDLERITEALTKDKSRIQTDFDTLKVQSSKKITMLNDMLKYEREKLKDDEGEWKATKKVLIKEVKSCRAQILALQAERDGLKEQNEMLKRAIVSTAKSPSNAAARTTSPMR